MFIELIKRIVKNIPSLFHPETVSYWNNAESISYATSVGGHILDDAAESSRKSGVVIYHQYPQKSSLQHEGEAAESSSKTRTTSCTERPKPTESSIQEKVINLNQLLLKKAAATCFVEDSARTSENFSHHVGYASLQIDQYQEPMVLHSVGNHHAIKGSLRPEDFFETSKQVVRNSEDYRCAQNDKSKQRVLDKLANVVGVIGQAGVGKSTLVKVLLSRICDKEKLYNVDFVFYAKLRDFYNYPELNLLEFLMGKAVCESIGWLKDEEVRDAVIEHLAKLDSVCILLDGLDEVIINTNISMDDVHVYGTELPEKFMLGLLSGQIFPKAKKIITSRPGNMLDLPDNFKPKFIVQIFGLNQEGFRQICQNICHDRAAEVQTQIENQPDLYSFTMVPIHCILIVNCIYQILVDPGPKQLPNNITDVFVLSFYFFTKSVNVDKKPNEVNVEDQRNLKKISYLAWCGMQNKQNNFSDEDLKRAGLTPKAISSFAVTIKRPSRKGRLAIVEHATENCTYFSHLFFQEFFAALYCLCFMNSKTFRKTFQECLCKENEKNYPFLMINKFLFGLSNSETFQTLSQNFKIYLQRENVDFLKKFLKKEALTLNKSNNKLNYVLRVCSWAYENHDQDLVHQISNSLPDHLEITGDFFVSDVLSFHHVIKGRSKRLFLNVVGAIFFGNASLILGEEMRNILACSSLIEFKKIDYNKKLLNDEKVRQISNLIIDGVEEINLQDCKLTASQVLMITSQISKLTKPIEHLKIEDNKVGNKGFTAVSSCLPNIVKLTIGDYDDSELTVEGIKTILSAVENKSTALQELKIFCRHSVYEQAKKEAQNYQSNIWTNHSQISFKAETVKTSGENECDKHIESVKKHLIKEAGRLSKINPPQYLHDTIQNIDLELCDNLDGFQSTTAESCGTADLSHLFRSAYNKITQQGTSKDSEESQLFVAVVGSAGSGKTTITKTLLNQYHTEKSLYGFDFVFCIRCSYTNLQHHSNLLEFLVKSLPHRWLKNKQICSQVLEKIKTNHKLCIIFDDINFSDMSFLNKCSGDDINDQVISATTFSKNIILGKLLSNAFKFVCVRPLEFSYYMGLSNELRSPLKTVYISGVNPNCQYTMLHSICGDKFDKIKIYLEAYPDLRSFCDIFANNLAVVKSITGHVQCIDKKIDPLLCIPLTSVILSSFVMNIWNFVLQHDTIDLSEVVNFAWKQFSKKQITFDQVNLSRDHNEIIDVFLQICAAEKDSSNYYLSFPSIVSDCFIAMYLLYFHESFDSVITCLLDRKSFSDNIVKFVCGLCNRSVSVYLEKLFPSPIKLVEKLLVLEDAVTNCLNNLEPSNKQFVSTTLFLCCLVFEMHDIEFAGRVADCLPNNINISNGIATDEVAGLSFVLLERKTDICIVFSAGSILNCTKLFEHAQKIITERNCFVRFINVS